MTDDSDGGFWSDFGQAVLDIAATAALQYGIQQITQGKQPKGGSTDYSIPDSRPIAIYPVGDYAPVAGAYALYETKDAGFHQVLAVSDWRLDSFNGFFLNDDLVTTNPDGSVHDVNGGAADGRYQDDPPRVFIKTRLGLPTETAYSEPASDYPTLWSSAHRGDGVGSAMVIFNSPQDKYRSKIYPVGIPRLRPICRAVCYDWRDPDQDIDDESTWGPSGNPVVWGVNIEWRKRGLDWTRFIAPVLDDLTAEADVCDEIVSGRARYRFGGNFRDDEDAEQVRARLRDCMDGFITRDGRGRLVIKCGHWEEPDITLTADHIISADWTLGIAENQRVTSLNVSYTAKDTFTRRDCDPWLVDPDGNRTEDFYPEWCQDFSQARRLAKIKAADYNPAGFGTIVTDEFGFLLQGKRFLRVQNPDNPFMADIYVKVQDHSEQDGIFTFTVRQVTAAEYEFNPATEEGADPGVQTRPVYAPLPPPTITSATPYFESYADGTTGVRIHIVAAGPSRGDLTWFYRVKKTSDTIWSEYTTGLTGSTPTINTVPVAVGVSIDVQVEYITGGGSPSGWSATTTATVPAGPRLDFSNRINSGYLAIVG